MLRLVLSLEMNLLRWFFGILLALISSIGFLALCVYLKDFHRVYELNYEYRFGWIYNMIFTALALMLFVLLSSLFCPVPKKKSALIAVFIALSLVVISLCFNFSEIFHRHRINTRAIIYYQCVISGILAGFFVSYFAFRHKGWDLQKKVEPDVEGF